MALGEVTTLASAPSSGMSQPEQEPGSSLLLHQLHPRQLNAQTGAPAAPSRVASCPELEAGTPVH